MSSSVNRYLFQFKYASTPANIKQGNDVYALGCMWSVDAYPSTLNRLGLHLNADHTQVPKAASKTPLRKVNDREVSRI